jgi:hypothetical protein
MDPLLWVLIGIGAFAGYLLFGAYVLTAVDDEHQTLYRWLMDLKDPEVEALLGLAWPWLAWKWWTRP